MAERNPAMLAAMEPLQLPHFCWPIKRDILNDPEQRAWVKEFVRVCGAHTINLGWFNPDYDGGTLDDILGAAPDTKLGVCLSPYHMRYDPEQKAQGKFVPRFMKEWTDAGLEEDWGEPFEQAWELIDRQISLLRPWLSRAPDVALLDAESFRPATEAQKRAVRYKLNMVGARFAQAWPSTKLAWYNYPHAAQWWNSNQGWFHPTAVPDGVQADYGTVSLYHTDQPYEMLKALRKTIDANRAGDTSLPIAPWFGFDYCQAPKLAGTGAQPASYQGVVSPGFDPATGQTSAEWLARWQRWGFELCARAHKWPEVPFVAIYKEPLRALTFERCLYYYHCGAHRLEP